MNNELERVRKKTVLDQFKELSRCLEREKNQDKPNDSLSPDRGLKPRPLEYEAGVLTTELRRSV
jgi:hypothetical protein